MVTGGAAAGTKAVEGQGSGSVLPCPHWGPALLAYPAPLWCSWLADYPISCWDWHREGAQGVTSVQDELFLLIQLRAPELRLWLALARASTSHTAGPSGPVTPWAGSSGLSEQFVFAAAKRIFPQRNTFEKGSFPELHGRARTRH